MKITCKAENLSRGLGVVSHVAGRTSALPILGNVLIQGEQSSTHLTTTNLELAVRSVVRGKVEGAGSATVSARVLAEYVSLLAPDEAVTLEQKGDTLAVTTASVSTTLQVLPATDFPVIPEFGGGASFSVSADELRRGLSRTLFAVSVDETRPEITGVLFHAAGPSLTLVSTDSYRLAECVVPLAEPVAAEVVKIVPWRTLQEVVRGIGSGAAVRVTCGDTQVRFETEESTIISRLIEGQYPQYQPIIPTSYVARCGVDSAILVRAVKQASLFCKPGVNDVRLASGGAKLTITAANSGVGDHKAELAVAGEGEPTGALFNYRFLLEGVAAIGSPLVSIQLTGEATPALLSAEQADGYRYVLMPIQQ